MAQIIYRDQYVTIFQSALFQTNTTVVRTDDCVIVVDPSWLPDEVMEIKHYVDTIKGLDPLFLVFTHSDYDHIIGYGAFQADKVITSEAFLENTQKEKPIEDIHQFDEQYYIKRPYPISYPKTDFVVYRDGAQFRYGHTKLSFFLMPGHTEDSMLMLVWHLGLCVAGDYFSDIEFPFIYHSSVAYLATLEKITTIHDHNFFTRLIPGHGRPALEINDWLHRRTESMAYILAVRESIATGVAFDEKALWERYKFPRLQGKYHQDNIKLMTQEYEQGLWEWNPIAIEHLLADKKRHRGEED
jgi:hydroxyacylglutathione hydrolase